MSWWILAVLAVPLALALRKALPAQRDSLPGDFDFDAYKSREITQRGVFDKTKWR